MNFLPDINENPNNEYNQFSGLNFSNNITNGNIQNNNYLFDYVNDSSNNDNNSLNPEPSQPHLIFPSNANILPFNTNGGFNQSNKPLNHLNNDQNKLLPKSGAIRRVRNPDKWKRNNYKKKVLPDKGPCHCPKFCFRNFSNQIISDIKAHFIKLKKIQQDEYLLTLIEQINNKNKKNPNEDNSNTISRSKYSYSIKYHINYMNKKEDNNKQLEYECCLCENEKFNCSSCTKINVCSFAFLSIIGIGKKRISNLVNFAYKQNGSLRPKIDLRGKHSNRKNRIDLHSVQLAENFILKFFAFYQINDNGIFQLDGDYLMKLAWPDRNKGASPLSCISERHNEGIDFESDPFTSGPGEPELEGSLAFDDSISNNDLFNHSHHINSQENDDTVNKIHQRPKNNLLIKVASGSDLCNDGHSSVPSPVPSASSSSNNERTPNLPSNIFLSPLLTLHKMYDSFLSHFQPIISQISGFHKKFLAQDKNQAADGYETTRSNLKCSICFECNNSLSLVSWHHESDNLKNNFMALVCSEKCQREFYGRFTALSNFPVHDFYLSAIELIDFKNENFFIHESALSLKPFLSRDKFDRIFRNYRVHFGPHHGFNKSIRYIGSTTLSNPGPQSCYICTSHTNNNEHLNSIINNNNLSLICKDFPEALVTEHVNLIAAYQQMIHLDRSRLGLSMKHNNGNVDLIEMAYKTPRPYTSSDSASNLNVNESMDADNSNNSSFEHDWMYTHSIYDFKDNRLSSRVWNWKDSNKSFYESAAALLEYIDEHLSNRTSIYKRNLNRPASVPGPESSPSSSFGYTCAPTPSGSESISLASGLESPDDLDKLVIHMESQSEFSLPNYFVLFLYILSGEVEYNEIEFKLIPACHNLLYSQSLWTKISNQHHSAHYGNSKSFYSKNEWINSINHFHYKRIPQMHSHAPSSQASSYTMTNSMPVGGLHYQNSNINSINSASNLKEKESMPLNIKCESFTQLFKYLNKVKSMLIHYTLALQQSGGSGSGSVSAKHDSDSMAKDLHLELDETCFPRLVDSNNCEVDIKLFHSFKFIKQNKEQAYNHDENIIMFGLRDVNLTDRISNSTLANNTMGASFIDNNNSNFKWEKLSFKLTNHKEQDLVHNDPNELSHGSDHLGAHNGLGSECFGLTRPSVTSLKDSGERFTMAQLNTGFIHNSSPYQQNGKYINPGPNLLMISGTNNVYGNVNPPLPLNDSLSYHFNFENPLPSAVSSSGLGLSLGPVSVQTSSPRIFGSPAFPILNRAYTYRDDPTDHDFSEPAKYFADYVPDYAQFSLSSVSSSNYSL